MKNQNISQEKEVKQKKVNKNSNSKPIVKDNEFIKIDKLTKTYGAHGIFDITLDIRKGEVFGYLGPNGAGKSTTIRHILGFIKPESGSVTIAGLDAWSKSTQVNAILGYIPGEIAMPEFMSGTDFIKYIFKLRKLTDWDYVQNIIDYWEFDPSVKIKKMSKGMKQKVGLVCAFMHNPDILILDEPTSGLDPLMQDKFVKLINKSKKEGKTIIMSSHIFQEIEKTCDRVAIIKNGKIISNIDMKEVAYNKEKTFDVQFVNESDYKSAKISGATLIDKSDKWLSQKLKVDATNVNDFVNSLSKYKLKFLAEVPFTLEDYFMKFYQVDGKEVKRNDK